MPLSTLIKIYAAAGLALLASAPAFSQGITGPATVPAWVERAYTIPTDYTCTATNAELTASTATSASFRWKVAGPSTITCTKSGASPLAPFAVTVTDNSVTFTYNELGERIARGWVVMKADRSGNPYGQPISQDSAGAIAVSLYPNPTSGILNLAVSGNDEEGKTPEPEFILADMRGRVLVRASAQNGQAQLDLSAYPQASYVLSMKAGKLRKQWSVLKQ